MEMIDRILHIVEAHEIDASANYSAEKIYLNALKKRLEGSVYYLYDKETADKVTEEGKKAIRKLEKEIGIKIWD